MLDEKGFTRPNYDEIVDDLCLKWRELFGETAQTHTRSVGGIIIRILAFCLNQIYMLAEKVYNSQFVDSASGATLDQLAANVGLHRLPAQVGIGTITIYGKAGYTVSSGTLFKTKDDLMYVTTEDITLEDSGEKSMSIPGYGTISANEGNLGTGVSHLLYADKLGADYNKSGEYTAEQVTPVEQILYATLTDVIGGTGIETDDNLRNRITLANNMDSSSPYNGVITAIRKVNGVKTVKIISNDTMENDPKTNTPAKAIHIYVNGGYKDDIAEAIFKSVAAGINTAGQQVTKVTDIAGINHVIKFDFPTNKGIYVDIHLEKNSMYPSDGDNQILNIVKQYLNSVDMGEVVRYTKFYQLIYSNVKGVDVADIKIGLSKEEVKAQDIVLSTLETAALADGGLTIS
ncbi:baseplate J/gp47 family protein [Ligilactobacillus equi]|uniref:Baseplate protein J-like barrel domain-containing protein n=1 Tax=Ligilactobacillus equi DSM 15833 = JCM 10991 TaxID=1423740 RepID=A0A0R1TTG8_9LACO|nr:baseplate J/gp47 family protein [Ligilactobacillus equi]KRL81816.1 hypothetical protein FC36_GL001411 [Ligilactobacillus equi DSM 15833 = JCM 10991]